MDAVIPKTVSLRTHGALAPLECQLGNTSTTPTDPYTQHPDDGYDAQNADDPRDVTDALHQAGNRGAYGQQGNLPRMPTQTDLAGGPTSPDDGVLLDESDSPDQSGLAGSDASAYER
jgi:hypothetical protein